MMEFDGMLMGDFTDIHVAFNYCQATGSAQLLRFVTEHTEVIPSLTCLGAF